MEQLVKLHAPVAVMTHLRQFAIWRATQPVSYTHLRAHETVLDLVCRLLLEQKKQKQKEKKEKKKIKKSKTKLQTLIRSDSIRSNNNKNIV